MLDEVLTALSPKAGGIYVDGTFGAGGYSRALLEAADCRVFAIDRDPEAVREGAAVVAAFPNRLTLIEGRFGDMFALLTRFDVDAVDGVALDVGVSSMQLDTPERGFSFSKDGPLDMRMSQTGPTAADIVNTFAPEDLSRIIAVLGEERRARAISRAIVWARAKARLETTRHLVSAVEQATGRQKHHERIHPATKTFQALRIYVNSELDELAKALSAAEHLLKPEGRLAVVTFHSLEDRIVKRFLAERSQARPSPSRHQPAPAAAPAPSFELLFKGHREASDTEVALNPRARSAKLRAARRTAAPAFKLDFAALGVPSVGEVRVL
jgi:16S rRNA (cytosine1402-N4)-methyltransferase